MVLSAGLAEGGSILVYVWMLMLSVSEVSERYKSWLRYMTWLPDSLPGVMLTSGSSPKALFMASVIRVRLVSDPWLKGLASKVVRDSVFAMLSSYSHGVDVWNSTVGLGRGSGRASSSNAVLPQSPKCCWA